jgi:competence protein ComEA
MGTRTSNRRLDARWTAGNRIALISLLVVAGPLLAVRVAARPLHVGSEIPVDAARVEATRDRINPNTATIASMLRLAGIGPLRADNIVAYRQVYGPNAFRSAEDLMKVYQIGPGILERIRDDLTLPRGD